MKNKQFLALALAGLMIVSQTSPVFATTIVEEDEPTTITSEVQTVDGAINITAANTKGSGVEGLEFKVVDAAGRQLQFVNNNDSYEVTDNGYYKTVTTDSDGKIKLSHLEDGSYTIIYTKSNSNYVTTSDATVSVNGGTVSVNIQVRENIGSMVFTLAGEDGSAVKNAKFVIKDSEGRNLSFSVSNGVYSYSQNGSEALETNIAGKFTVERLPVGTYTLVQTESPVEYNGELITKDFTISLENETKISATSTKHYGSASISVVDSKNSNSLKGSEFNVVDSSGNKVLFEYTNGEYAFTREGGSNVVKTGSNGTCLLSGLPVGDYTLKETATPEGYDASADKTFSITKNETTKIAVTNVESVGSLEILVTDEKTADNIKDYSFKITDSEDNELKFTKDSEGVYSFNGEETEVTSDENGKIVINNLPAGKYKVVQSKAASGYVIDKTASEQEIISQQTTTYEVKASKTNVAISVVNEDNEGLENISVQIVDKDNKVVLEGTTTEGGKFLLSDLSEGDYTYTLGNIESPYMNMKYTGTFSINEKGEISNLKECTVKYNAISIELNEAIEGAKFELVNKDDESNKYVVETDKDGKASISKLEDGTYILTQIEAPEGYVLSEGSKEIVIDRNTDKEISVNVTNDPISATTETAEPATEKSVPGVILLIGGMIVIILGAVGYALWKTRNEPKPDKKQESEKKDNNIVIENPEPTYEEPEVEEPPVDEDIPVERPDVKEMNEDPYSQETEEELGNNKPDVSEISSDPYDEKPFTFEGFDNQEILDEGTIPVEADVESEQAKVEPEMEAENTVIEETTDTQGENTSETTVNEEHSETLKTEDNVGVVSLNLETSTIPEEELKVSDILDIEKTVEGTTDNKVTEGTVEKDSAKETDNKDKE